MAIRYRVNHFALNERIGKKFGTQSKFLNHLGISRQAWNYKITAESISIKSIVAICNALDISINSFKDYFLEKVE